MQKNTKNDKNLKLGIGILSSLSEIPKEIMKVSFKIKFAWNLSQVHENHFIFLLLYFFSEYMIEQC